ncbi:MAG: tetratricopeptide repeat protein [Planctomycetota bacterium]|nr:tetratricopeptide repeat protein [Planctomycetota bacterium]
MNAERFRHIEELFHRAKALEAADRASFLDRECPGDLALRAEVESLLAHSGEQTEQIEVAPDGGFRAVMIDRDGDSTAMVDRGPPTERPGTQIGNYKILQEIGEGGFGVVYMAEQQRPVQRKVALKIIKLGMDTKQVIARFEAERQALAMMDHPNIARVLEAGATETGRPFFVMELVKGIPITDYCDQNRLSTRRRLELFIQVCGAVQHAHQKGIIHRDLKPSNVLVTLHDDVAVPKVIDFGIAKATGHRLTDKTLFTEFRQFIGTPEYMSPDQAEISALDVDTRTDIYSLGVMLYELLTGTTPFDGRTLRSKGHGEIQRIIREVDPPKPSTRVETLAPSGDGTDIARRRQVEPGALSRLMRGDLDWIVMKAMEKDRTRRFQSAGELAADVRRHLNNEPIVAGPPSLAYKLRKFVQRNRVGVVAGLLIAGALIIGLTLAAIGFVEARQEARRSQRIAEFLQDLYVITNPLQTLGQEPDVEGLTITARDVFGDDHATVAAVLNGRAMQLQSAGQLAAAEDMYRESLRIWRRQYGGDNINVASTLSSLGVLRMLKGDNAGAERDLREALRIMRTLPGGESVALCESLAVLAQVLAMDGRFDEAESMFREAIRIRVTHAPHQKLQLALNYHSLANILSMAGRMEDLKELAPTTINAWREAMPADSMLLARVLTEYGAIYLRDDELAEAEPILREAAEIFSASDETAAQYREIVLDLLYRILQRRETPGDEFVRSRLEFAEYARDAAGPDQRVLGAVLTQIINDLKGEEALEAALPLAWEVLDLARQVEDGQRVPDALRELGNVAWHIVRRPGRAEALYREALRAIEVCVEETPDSPAFTNTLGVAQYRLGRYEEALETLARSDALYSALPEGAMPADVAFIAMAHHRLGHADKAQAAMTRLRTIMAAPEKAELEENRWFLAEAEALLDEAPEEDRDNKS